MKLMLVFIRIPLETLFIPILPLNTYKGIWGEDADEFRLVFQ